VRSEPSVLHLDADAFFAAVEQRQRPSLRGRPVIVAGLGPRGVVATASYEARRFGVGSAMPTARARTLCPAGTFVIPRFAAYAAHSAVLMELLREVSPLVQPISLDEAFVDLAAGGHDDPLAVADRIRREFWSRTGLVVSIGLGRSKLIAKLASEAGKPHGWTVITGEQEDDFLLPTPVGRLWGVGPATEAALATLGVRTVAELREVPRAELVRRLGTAHGNGLHRLAYGMDERPVEADREIKSVGAERTFAFDVTGRPAQLIELETVFGHARKRLARHGGGVRTVTVKARFSDFSTVTRAVSLPQPTADDRALLEAATRAMDAAIFEGAPIRLLGVSFSGLVGYEQPMLAADDGGETSVSPGDVEELSERELPAPLTAADAYPGVDVHVAGLGDGWVVACEGDRLTVRIEGPTTAPGADRRVGLGRDEILQICPPAVQPLPQRYEPQRYEPQRV
jgi:DNA polymerase-4